ncbi:MAG: hypothetical protein EON85_10040 [Brevundimonas sp.]|nr:MAG: hypothetical protein EON85_10040 [Brevundimonas sp.]
MNALSAPPKPSWPRRIGAGVLSGAIFGAVGYAVGKVAAEAFPGFSPDLTGLRWADVIAAALSALLLVASIATALSSFNRKGLGQMLKLEGPAGDSEVRDVRIQSAVLGLSGVVMALPMVLSGLAVPPVIALGAVVLLLVVHTALNLQLFRSVDELFRRTVVEAGAATFWLGQGLLFLWAAAERLAAAPPITAWDVYVVLMGVYLVVSMIVTLRRGLA